MDAFSLSKRVFKRPENVGEQEFEGLNLDVTDTITGCGQKGTGKSYLFSVLADSYPNVVFWDARWERYTKQDKKAQSVKALCMPDKWVTADDVQSLREKLMQGKTHIIYHPAPLQFQKRVHADMIQEFNEVCQVVFDYGGVSLFVDEADNVCDPHHIPEGAFNIMEYGKHRNVGSVWITRRLQHLNTRIPRLSSLLVFFRLSAKDFHYISEFLIEPDENEEIENYGQDEHLEKNKREPNQEDYENKVITKNQWMEKIRKKITHLEDRYFYTFDGKSMIPFKPIPEMIKS